MYEAPGWFVYGSSLARHEMCSRQYAAFTYSFPFPFSLPFLPPPFSSPFFFLPRSFPYPLSPPPLHPSWCSSQTQGDTKAQSLYWSWEEAVSPLAPFDDGISNDTLIPTPNCLFFRLYDEMQLETRATGHIIKMGAQTRSASLVPRNHSWQFFDILA